MSRVLRTQTQSQIITPPLTASTVELDQLVGYARKIRFDIRFWRDGTETPFEVLQGDPEAVERSSFGGHCEQAELA